MALTKTDLSQIRKVVREEVESESDNIRRELGVDIKMLKYTVSNDISSLSSRVKNVEIGVKSLETKATKNHKELKAEIKHVVDFLDKDNLRTLARVKRLEEHAGISSQN